MTLSGRHNPVVRAKELRYAIDLSGELRTEDGTALEADPAWTPEHLLLAALVRCSLKSLELPRAARRQRPRGRTGKRAGDDHEAGSRRALCDGRARRRARRPTHTGRRRLRALRESRT